MSLIFQPQHLSPWAIFAQTLLGSGGSTSLSLWPGIKPQQFPGREDTGGGGCRETEREKACLDQALLLLLLICILPSIQRSQHKNAKQKQSKSEGCRLALQTKPKSVACQPCLVIQGIKRPVSSTSGQRLPQSLQTHMGIWQLSLGVRGEYIAWWQLPVPI
ncbi:Hypothetical predicted protein [Podarcis lilfordi]|uniref:Uncharacterized protein n=1 Tax=Podarcis lilfordi TaxID=74358 RepID=A0AA35K781_9SAUR|nr:Hypothetical predicted protein [Podarcis lilfordi]